MIATIVDHLLGKLLSIGSRCIVGLQRIGLKGTAARLGTRTHVLLYRRSRGKLGGQPGAPSLLLTTTGRKSGKPRTVAVYYLPDAERQILVASYGGDAKHPAWYLNLVADPSAIVQIGADVRPVRARDADAAERADLWPRLTRNWPAYDDYQARTSRVLPVVILERA
jgi:deazaflavin-dependent oxidoreductase (nitroreductase family)